MCISKRAEFQFHSILSFRAHLFILQFTPSHGCCQNCTLGRCVVGPVQRKSDPTVWPLLFYRPTGHGGCASRRRSGQNLSNLRQTMCPSLATLTGSSDIVLCRRFASFNGAMLILFVRPGDSAVFTDCVSNVISHNKWQKHAITST
jgi:hypothetical protein